MEKGVSVLPIHRTQNQGDYDGNPDQKERFGYFAALMGPVAEVFNMMPLDQVRTLVRTKFDVLWPGFSKEIQGIEFYRFHPAPSPRGRQAARALTSQMKFESQITKCIWWGFRDLHSDGAFYSAMRSLNSKAREPKEMTTFIWRPHTRSIFFMASAGLVKNTSPKCRLRDFVCIRSGQGRRSEFLL